MEIREIIATEMAKRRRRAGPGGETLMCLLSFGIREVDLARKLNVTPASISCWRRGLRPIPANRQAELHGLLRKCLSSKQAVVAALRREGKWDKTMGRILRQQFREAKAVLEGMPPELREGTERKAA